MMLRAVIVFSLLASVMSLQADDAYLARLMNTIADLSEACGRFAKPELEQNINLPREEGCKLVKAAKTKEDFVTNGPCSQNEYDSVKDVVCGESNEEYLKELDQTIAKLSEGCESYARQEVELNINLPRDQGCKIMKSEANVKQFVTEGPCSQQEYDSVKDVICGNGGNGGNVVQMSIFAAGFAILLHVIKKF